MFKDPELSKLALRGIRVLEVGEGPALAYAGKLFADFGAEVIKIESADGDPWRHMPPLIQPEENAQPESALFAWMNTNKRSVIANVCDDQDRVWLGELARSCDVILDSRAMKEGVEVLDRPIWLECVEDHSVDGDIHQPIAVDLTWFGEDGPYRDYTGSESVCRAMAGATHGSGPVVGPPQMPHDVQAGIQVGLATFSVALSGWFGREQGSRRYVISFFETIFSLVEMEAGMVQDKRHAPRLGVNRFGTTHPASIYQTQDGWIGIFTNTLAQWDGLCIAIGRPELGHDPRFSNGPDRMKHADLIDEILISVFPTKSTQEWFELLTEQKQPAVFVPTMEQLLKQAVHRERKAFVPVKLGQIEFEAPVLSQRLEEAGPLLGGKAPRLGADTAFYHDAGLLRASQKKMRLAPADKLPLTGLRILDLSMGWAGPFASRKLADLGAEVIKIESPSYPDWWRGANYTEQFYRERLYEKNNNYNLLNRNKQCVTLDLTKPEGKQLFLDLVKHADAVIENYSAEVLPKLKLDYPVLSRVNPRILMLSMPAYGLGNAWSNTRAYGGTLEQASGLPLYFGHPDGPPAMTSYAYGDPNGGLNATAAMLLGLLVQRETGQGRLINMSQIEGMLALTAPFLIEQSVSGRVSERQSNLHPMRAPHGCYPCAGQDSWLMLSIASNAQWKSLCDAMQRKDWIEASRFADVKGRLSARKELDEGIALWTSQHPVDALVDILQSKGVPAGCVQTMHQVMADPHLLARGFWQTVPRDFVGTYITSSTYFRQNGQPMPIRRVAPTLGQHTNQVLQDILNMTVDQLTALEAQGVTGTEAKPKRA